MKKSMLIFSLIVLISATSGCLLSEEEKKAREAYQAEFDKILPLNEDIKIIDGTCVTETKEFREYLIIRGQIEEVHEEIIEEPCYDSNEQFIIAYDIIFSDGKEVHSLLAIGTNEYSIAYMEGGINRIIIYKSNSRIKEITY